MIRSEVRRSARPRDCDYCGGPIKAGELYRNAAYSPQHEDLGNFEWWHSHECAECALRYGRPVDALVVPA